MNIQHPQHQMQLLLQKFISLTIKQPSTPPQTSASTPTQTSTPTTQSNTLIAAQMPFQLHPCSISQYNKLYLSRLAILGKRISFESNGYGYGYGGGPESKGPLRVCRIQSVEERLGRVCVIGIFKRIEVKRVRAFEKGYEEYYSSNKPIYNQLDTLQLEDSTGKLKFILSPTTTINNKPLTPTDLPHGIIIGLTGKFNDQKMQFLTERITLPTLPPQKPFTPHHYPHPRLSLLISSPTVQQLYNTLHQICSVRNLQFEGCVSSVVVIGFREKLTGSDCRRLDQLFEGVGDCVDLFLMQNQVQGEIYPQKPMHPILFPKSHKKISLVNNPQIFHPNSNPTISTPPPTASLPTSILISSGQNIRDLAKNSSKGSCSLDLMQSLLEYSHMAPTSPFSLKCSLMAEDYLVVDQLPHLFVVGGCEGTGVREWVVDGEDVNGNGKRMVRLVAVRDGDSVLVDIDSLEMEVMNYWSAGAADDMF